ncbi:MAG: class I SAM-dependent RNA methyltransferase [Rhodocyclales bacterium]|nr:class I SAM-dependent RNA methyltransferase [Rhodocyclales bacterium]
MKPYQYFSPCPRGLEPLLAEDAAAAGATEIRQVPGGVEFAGDLACCYRVNLESHIATRVLWRLATADYHKEDDIYQLARGVDWPRLFAVERTIRIYVTAQRSPLKSLEFITLRVKDAVCDRFRDATGQRPTVNTKSPDVRIHLFLTDHRATLYLDTSGEPLWQRGHKIAKVEAPLKENLAAGILRLAGWQPGVPLLDPMCGSGTFLLEAAQMSLADPPGMNREPGGFAFERLMSFQPELWREVQKSAVAARRVADTLPIWGSDSSADAVARAAQNLAHAGFDDLVKVECADLLQRTAPAPTGLLVCNPPYGERLGELDELAALYPRIGDALKRNFSGWDCWFLSADTRLPKLIGLKPMRKIPLYNGALECRLYGFRMVAGSNR